MFFDGEVDISRFDKVKYQQFEKLTRQQIGYFWTPEEVDLTKDNKDFKGFSPVEIHIAVSNLQRQILLDSVQGRAPSLAFLPITSLPELETWITTWTFFESIHSRSYTHIIRNAFPDPSLVFDNMLDIKEITDCAVDVSKYYDELINWNAARYVYENRSWFVKLLDWTFSKSEYNLYEHKKALWLCLNAVNVLEGIRFYASFACSWNFSEQKKMEGNAKIIKLIARDENLHLAATQHILKLLPKEDVDFAKISQESEEEVFNMFDAVVKQEHDWAKYLFKDGSMIGLNERLLCDFVDERADKCLKNLGYQPRYGNKQKVLPWTAKWIAGGDVQVAPQETQSTSYTVGRVKQDLTEDKFKGFKL